MNKRSIKARPIRGRVIALLLVIICLPVLTTSCRTDNAAKPKVTIGIQMSPAMALVMVAKDRGCFDEAGVDVELKPFSAGKFALQAFLGNSLDFAVAGEVPVTLATNQGNRLAILAQVVERTITEVRVVARRDGELNTPEAYFHAKKRTLATSFGGGPEFFTYNFLKKYNIAPDQISIVSMKPEDMPVALINHSIDAISVFDPYAYLAERGMGSQGITFSDPNLYSELYVLVAKPEDVSQRRDVIDRVLRGLVKAQEIIKNDPEGAKQIVVKYTQLEPDVVNGIWKNFAFAPALNQLLLDLLNAETAWAKEKGDVPKDRPTPDFRREFIYDEPLRAIKPDAVKLP